MASPRKSFVLGCLSGVVLGPVLLCGIGLAILFIFREPFTNYAAKQQESRLAQPRLGTGLDADYSLALHTLDGEALTLEAYRGRTALLYFWHPGCVACLAGLPALKDLAADIMESDAEIVMVAIDDAEDVEAVRQSYGLDFPQYVLDGDRPAVFNTTSVTPAAYLVAPDGAIVFRHAGAALWNAETLAALIRVVAKPRNAA